MDKALSRSADEVAFLRQFMAEERPLLRFILRYVPSVADARDVMQETLVTLWAKRAEFDATREFLPWACGIARNKVREFWRRQPRWQAFADHDLMSLIDSRQEALSAGLSLRAEKLRDCVAKLPAEQRANLTRYYNDEESVEIIALREGRTVDAIYKMLQRTRRNLLECVERGIRNDQATA
jgi:RNA polymerase sigma-70 factor (ECF subfamily)